MCFIAFLLDAFCCCSVFVFVLGPMRRRQPQAAPRSAPKRYVPKIYGFKIFHPSHLKNSAAITAAANGDRPATGSRGVGAGAGAAPETAAAGGAAAAAAVAAAAAAAEDPAAGDEDDLASTKKRKSRQ